MNRTIRTDQDKEGFKALVDTWNTPFTVRLTKGVDRSLEQNSLQHLWYTEIADQLGDRTFGEVRAECKLTIGIPILCRDDEEYRSEYYEVLRPLPYEFKIKLMSLPLDYAVTRLMTVKQMTEYLDGIDRKYSEFGVRLTQPEER